MTEYPRERTTILAPAEVRAFVARVREHLGDLDAEEQQELTIGLEADLTDLVAEHGPEALGDPVVYARELRTAAGHDPVMRPRPGVRGVPRAVMEAIDTVHETWRRLLGSFPGDLGGFLGALQPVWWVLRAWVAWMFAQDLRAPDVVIDGPWLAVLGVFVVVSVQLGRRAWGIGRLLTASVLARLLLVGLNVFAVTMLPGAVDRLSWHIAEEKAWQFGWETAGGAGAVDPDAITYQGRQACVLEVRDASGRAIPRAYVWDVTGDRPLPMNDENC